MQKTITIRGVVESGQKLGRTLGFPTANVHPDAETCRIAAGVWLARVAVVGGDRYWGLVNVGWRPTVENETAGDGRVCKAEAWLFDFEGDLYGREIEIEPVRFLRSEIKFGSLDELRRAIERDKQNALNIIERDEFTL